MTNIILIIVGDFLYIKESSKDKARRVKVTHIGSNDLIYGSMYNRSTKVYDKIRVDLAIITGVRLMSRKNVDVDEEKSALIVCEVC